MNLPNRPIIWRNEISAIIESLVIIGLVILLVGCTTIPVEVRHFPVIRKNYKI